MTSHRRRSSTPTLDERHQQRKTTRKLANPFRFLSSHTSVQDAISSRPRRSVDSSDDSNDRRHKRCHRSSSRRKRSLRAASRDSDDWREMRRLKARYQHRRNRSHSYSPRHSSSFESSPSSADERRRRRKRRRRPARDDSPEIEVIEPLEQDVIFCGCIAPGQPSPSLRRRECSSDSSVVSVQPTESLSHQPTCRSPADSSALASRSSSDDNDSDSIDETRHNCHRSPSSQPSPASSDPTLSDARSTPVDGDAVSPIAHHTSAEVSSLAQAARQAAIRRRESSPPSLPVVRPRGPRTPPQPHPDELAKTSEKANGTLPPTGDVPYNPFDYSSGDVDAPPVINRSNERPSSSPDENSDIFEPSGCDDLMMADVDDAPSIESGVHTLNGQHRPDLRSVQYLQKVQRQERIVDEVKTVLKPFYARRSINKESYKDIMRKCVTKISSSKRGIINAFKIQQLVIAYVKRYRYLERCHSQQQQ